MRVLEMIGGAGFLMTGTWEALCLGACLHQLTLINSGSWAQLAKCVAKVGTFDVHLASQVGAA